MDRYTQTYFKFKIVNKGLVSHSYNAHWMQQELAIPVQNFSALEKWKTGANLYVIPAGPLAANGLY